MIVVALTGGIGAGKSTVSAGLVARGAVLIDADAIVHELQQPGSDVLDVLAERFGAEIITDDGALDRPALASIVFGDADALKDLNRIIHPRVGEEITARLRDLSATDDIVVLDIPLLAEGLIKGQPARYPSSGVLVVDVPVEEQVARLTGERGMSEDEARARIASQVTRDERLSIADRVLDNAGPLADLDAEIDAVMEWAQGLPPATLSADDAAAAEDPQSTQGTQSGKDTNGHG